MNEHEYYESLRNRYQTACFKQDQIPDKELIEKILKESVESTPVFNGDYHYAIDVFGPEYSFDKRKVCLQTIEDKRYRKMFDSRKKGEYGISTLYHELSLFEQQIEDFKMKEKGFSVLAKHAKTMTFNMQVMAPYLLLFRYSPDQFIHYDKEEGSKAKKTKSIQASMTNAYAISIIADHYGVQSGFCGCFILNDENVNEVFYNDADVWFMMGLGYKEDWCYSAEGSKHHRLRQEEKPTHDKVVNWA